MDSLVTLAAWFWFAEIVAAGGILLTSTSAFTVLAKPDSLYRPIAALVSEGFLSRLSFGLVSFALPLYAEQMGMDLPAIGLLASLNVMVSLAFRPVAGWLADRVGLKRVFVAGVVLRGLETALLVFAVAPWQLFAIRAAHGVAQSLRDSSVNVLLAERGGEQRVASAFAWSATAKNMAGSLGAALAGVLLTASGAKFPLVFVTALVLSTLPLYVVLRFIEEPAASVRSAKTARRRTATDGGDWRAIASFTSLGFLVTGTAQMFKGLLPVLATTYAGLDFLQAGAVYLLSTLVVLLCGPLFGWLADNVSHRLVFAVRSLANITSSLILLAFPNLAGVTLGTTVDDVGKTAYVPAWGRLMARVARSHRRRRAQAMAVMTASEDGGAIVAPVVTGLVWSAWGVPAVLLLRVLLAAGTELYAFALFRSLETRPRASRRKAGSKVDPSRWRHVTSSEPEP